ncbi:MAG: Gfo/Idh/MocA family oxidoreductase [Clostridiales bacterium]|nr:Gfo/Idh/MocA family oxidoreductase [Clostridiales bacterium]
MKKLAMIGCGGIGEYHLQHFLEYRDVELAGFCDIIPERAQAFAERAGGRAFADFREMYDRVSPDMVFICIPPYAHGEIELETVARGIPMFVEKPLALDVELARRILRAVEAKGLITASGFQCRYSNLVEPTRQFVAEHPIEFIGCSRMGGIPGTPWWAQRRLSGGQIVEQTIHQFDMIRYIVGEPELVFTLGNRTAVRGVKGFDTEALSATVVRFQSGALGSISTGCYARDGACYDSKITFSAADARLDHYIIDKVVAYGESAARQAAGLVVQNDGTMRPAGDGVTTKDDGRAGALCDRTFVDAAISGDGSKIRSPYADALKSLIFTLACNRSIDTGEPVEIAAL